MILFLGDYDHGKLNVNMILYFIRFNWTKVDSEAFLMPMLYEFDLEWHDIHV